MSLQCLADGWRSRARTIDACRGLGRAGLPFAPASRACPPVRRLCHRGERSARSRSSRPGRRRLGSRRGPVIGGRLEVGHQAGPGCRTSRSLPRSQWKSGFLMFRQWPPFVLFSDWKNRCDASTAARTSLVVRQPMFSPQFRIVGVARGAHPERGRAVEVGADVLRRHEVVRTAGHRRAEPRGVPERGDVGAVPAAVAALARASVWTQPPVRVQFTRM